MDIRTKEAVRYLGYGNRAIDEQTEELIRDSFKELEQVSRAKFIYRIFEISELNSDELMIGTMKVYSKHLCKNLKGCHAAFLICATLGAGVDMLMKRYTVTNMAKTAVLQACATTLLEEYCDNIQKQLADMLEHNEYLRARFSPGYGDFSITYQKEILRMMNASKEIGLSLTDGYMLTPTKSITALIGITNEKIICHASGCEVCSKIDCTFRRGETGC